MAARYSVEPKQLLETMRQTLARNATNEELMAFSIVADQYKLNPFVREIYAFPAKGGGITPMVSIDGWLRIINTHPKFDGMETRMSSDGTECTAIIYRKDTSHPTVVTEYLDECKRNTDPWNKSPRRMLRHKAIIQCGRVAFGFGGIYDEDEGGDVTSPGMRDVTPQITTPSFLEARPDAAQPKHSESSVDPDNYASDAGNQDDAGAIIPGLDMPSSEPPSFGSLED